MGKFLKSLFKNAFSISWIFFVLFLAVVKKINFWLKITSNCKKKLLKIIDRVLKQVIYSKLSKIWNQTDSYGLLYLF